MRRPPRAVTFEIDYERPMVSGQVAHVWHCTLTCHGRALTTYVATYGRRPTQTAVFDCLVRDARDDLTAHRCETAWALRDLLGPDLYRRVLDEWEALP